MALFRPLYCPSIQRAAIMGVWHGGPAAGEAKGRENGSVLIFILVAVVLFAGLTAAMNQGSRTSGGMVTDQQARLYATEIIAYGNSVKQAVQRMQMNGISESDFDFGNLIFTFVNGNPLMVPGHNSRCTSNACKVFHPEGGGLTPRPTSGSLDGPNPTSWKGGHWAAYRAPMDGIGTDERDLIYVTGRVQREVCIKINESLGVPNPGGEPPSFHIPGETFYNGNNFSSPLDSNFSGGTVTGRPSYCYQMASEGSAGTYKYNITLIAR